MKRRTPPSYLTEAFREDALGWYLHGDEAPDQPMRLFDGGPACWLWQFDPLERPCEGRLEAIHLIDKQAIRRVLRHLLVTDLWADGAIDPLDVDDLVELAEWDGRNGASGCTGHHRRADSLATPRLEVPAQCLRDDAIEFVTDWGLRAEAARRFSGADEVLPADERLRAVHA